MKNQDPTNPTDSSQMTSQLAQISTVSGIGQLNTSLTSLATQLSAGQSTQAALLIGSTVLAPGSSSRWRAASRRLRRAARPTRSSDLKVNVKNSSGQIVNTLDLGAQPAGTVPVSGWTPADKTGATLPDGTYTITRGRHDQRPGGHGHGAVGSTVQSVVQQADGTPGLVLSNGTTVGADQRRLDPLIHIQ